MPLTTDQFDDLRIRLHAVISMHAPASERSKALGQVDAVLARLPVETPAALEVGYGSGATAAPVETPAADPAAEFDE